MEGPAALGGEGPLDHGRGTPTRRGTITTPRSRPASGVTLRAVLTGAVLMAVICHLGPWAILEVKGSQLTNTAIPIIAVLFLFAMTAVAVPVLGALHRRLAFSRSEVITVYGMMLVGSTIVTGFTGHFLSVITGAHVLRQSPRTTGGPSSWSTSTPG